MDKSRELLNEVLVKIFNQILFNEESVLNDKLNNKISVRNIHILEVIDKINEDCKATTSNVSKRLNITAGTLTVAVKKLISNGFVTRIQCKDDKRVYYLKVTNAGKKILKVHEEYHKNMIETIVGNLSIKETADLVDLLSKIKYYFS